MTSFIVIQFIVDKDKNYYFKWVRMFRVPNNRIGDVLETTFGKLIEQHHYKIGWKAYHYQKIVKGMKVHYMACALF